MASRHITRPLTRAERAFVRDALLAAEIPVLLKGRRLSPEGAAHVASDYALALLLEFRRITKGVI